MESTASAWPFVFGACIVGLGLIITGLIGLPIALPELNFGLLTKTSGVLPSDKLRWVAAGVLVAILVLSLSFWWTVKLITDDHAVRVAEAKGNALAPVVDGSPSVENKVMCSVRYYQNLGFVEKAKFESVDGGEVRLLSKFEQDQNQIWRAEGVLVYEEAESTRFSVGIVYGEGAWLQGDARKIERKGLRRKVNLETVLKAQELRELSDRNDYLLTLGLASNSENEDPEKNWRLSLARAHNLGVAALRLGWKSADRIWPQTIGHSKSFAQNELEGRQQRPVVMIGVIANRKVAVPDVTYGTMEIVPLNLVDLAGYSTSIREPREPRRVSAKSDYLDENDINPQPTKYEARTLSAILKENEGDETGCVNQ